MTGMGVEEAKGPDEDRAMLAAALRLLHDLLALKQDKVCSEETAFLCWGGAGCLPRR